MYTWLVLVMGVFYTIPALQVNLHMLQPHPQECNKGYKDDAKQTETYHMCYFPLQLVLNYERELISTGNQDLCFYNFQCARPVSQF